MKNIGNIKQYVKIAAGKNDLEPSEELLQIKEEHCWYNYIEKENNVKSLLFQDR